MYRSFGAIAYLSLVATSFGQVCVDESCSYMPLGTDTSECDLYLIDIDTLGVGVYAGKTFLPGDIIEANSIGTFCLRIFSYDHRSWYQQ
jgi:hypothetical protein